MSVRVGFPSFQDLRKYLEQQFGGVNVTVLDYIPHEMGTIQTVSKSRGGQGYVTRVLEAICLNNHTYKDQGECWVFISWKKNQLDYHNSFYLGYYNALQLGFDREGDCVF